MIRPTMTTAWTTILALAASATIAGHAYAQTEPRGKTSYAPVAAKLTAEEKQDLVAFLCAL